MIRRGLELIIRFSQKMYKDRVRAHAAEASFFIMMSIFPILMLLLTLIHFLPYTVEQMIEIIGQITPFAVNEMLNSVVQSILNQSYEWLPYTVIAALWAAGKCIIGITDGLNSIYRVTKSKGYILMRIRATVYAMIMIVAFAISIGILGFGYSIQIFLKNNLPIYAAIYHKGTFIPTLLAMLVLVLIFSVFYTFLPDMRQKFFQQLPGAIFSAVSWTVFSYVFSLYLKYAVNMSLLYGSLTTLVAIMLWLYICMYLLFLGAELNDYILHPDLFPLNSDIDRYRKIFLDR